jgi:LPS-assembly lipoprotein
MYSRLSQYSVTLVMTCLLAACGFQLRGVGSSAVPEVWKNMYLVTDSPNSDFSRDVVSQLDANDVQWTDRENATFILVLSPELFKQRNLSLNSQARVAELELTMSSQFTIVDARSEVIMPLTTVLVVKQMENNPRNEIGNASEIRLIQGEMRSELAAKIMRRISFYAASFQYSAAASLPTTTPADSPAQ